MLRGEKIDMEQKRIFDILTEVAKCNKEKIAFVDDNSSITFDSLIDNINLVSQSLINKVSQKKLQ